MEFFEADVFLLYISLNMGVVKSNKFSRKEIKCVFRKYLNRSSKDFVPNVEFANRLKLVLRQTHHWAKNVKYLFTTY